MTDDQKTAHDLSGWIAHCEQITRFARTKEERDSAFRSLAEARIALYHLRQRIGE